MVYAAYMVCLCKQSTVNSVPYEDVDLKVQQIYEDGRTNTVMGYAEAID